MKPLGQRDKLLLWSVLLFWIPCFALHVKEVVRTGLAEPPIFATAAPSGVYPIVGGHRLERGTGGEDFQVGDVLLRVGDVDLRGVGYFGFDAIALEQAGRGLETPVVLERDGVRRSVRLELLGHEIPWFRAFPIVAMVLVSVLVLLRAPSADSRRLFAATMGIAILQTHFLGGPRWQTYAALTVFNLFGGVAVSLVFRWIICFPPELERSRRVSMWWSALGFLYYVPRACYVLGGPIPTDSIPQVVLTLDGLFLILLLAIGTRNYRVSNPVGRRRFKWLLFGAYLGVLPLGLVLLQGAVLPDAASFPFFFQLGVLMTVAFSAGILVAVIRANLFDIDRILSVTASWSLALMGVVAALIAVFLPLARALASAMEMDPLWVQSGLGLLATATAIPAGQRLRPTIDRVFFPERAALKRGSDSLLRDLGRCAGAEDVILTLAERVDALLRPDFCVLYARSGARFEELYARGERTPDAIDVDGSIHAVLAEHGVPLQVASGSADREGGDFDREDRELLSRMECRLIIPILEHETVTAFIALGAKRSRDVYTATELSRLTALSSRASREVQRIRDARSLSRGREELETMRIQVADADASNLAKSRFLASASHDLRQPLHALGLLSEALAQRLPDRSVEHLVGRIQDTVGNLQEMMDGILDLSKLEAGRVETRLEDFAIGPMLERIKAEFAIQAESKGLELRVRPSAALVRSDRLLLARILHNLVVNALRYTDHGRVLVACRSRGDDLSIEVWDTGRGIPQEQLAGVFEEFQQLERDLREEGPGLGLGLSIVDRLARLMGHDVDVRSREGSGTRFAIRVPRAASTSAPEPASYALPSDGIEGSVILVVDDEDVIREGMRELVEPWGCRVLTAGSLEEAVAAATRSGNRPDVIVSDYRLGAAALGPAVIEAVCEAVRSTVPALIVTGDTSKVSVEELRSTGHPFINKPVRPAKLRAALSELLRRRSEA